MPKLTTTNLALLLGAIAFLCCYTLSGGSYSGMVIGFLLIPGLLVFQIMILKYFLPQKPKDTNIE
ncbi:hypothetical protein [Bythopirellula goksoeyrii]|uniref:hypothetical protein n=1 Tax=Bythopirellula goksoeyrii TaxID=1400387 RepID=UPI0011CD400C|nr:hypothetical protein [Bythopirellula goksoeyrii]